MPPQRCLPEPWPHADDGTGGRGLKGGSLCWCGASCPGKSLAGAAEATRQGSCRGNLLRPSALCGLGLGVALIVLGFDLTLAHLPRSAWCGRGRGSDCPCTGKGVQRCAPIFVHRHLKKMWLTDFNVCLQSGHRPQFGHPLLSNLSVVQTRFCIASQAKNFILGGAHAFQTAKPMGELTNPRSCALYADVAE